MAKWNHTIDVSEQWKRAENDEISLYDFSNYMCSVLKKFQENNSNITNGLDFQEILDDFETYAETKDQTSEAFDYYWDNFYNFCDDNRIWIKTV